MNPTLVPSQRARELLADALPPKSGVRRLIRKAGAKHEFVPVTAALAAIDAALATIPPPVADREAVAGSFRKLPVMIEAWQFNEDWSGLPSWLGEAIDCHVVQFYSLPTPQMRVDTLEGTMRANLGDWIIRGVTGELYPCKPDIFEATYEPAALSQPTVQPETGAGGAAKEDIYRGWSISWDYGSFRATGPNYDASYEGPEDGWITSGGSVEARTRGGLIAEIDAWIEEHPEDRA